MQATAVVATGERTVAELPPVRRVTLQLVSASSGGRALKSLQEASPSLVSTYVLLVMLQVLAIALLLLLPLLPLLLLLLLLPLLLLMAVASFVVVIGVRRFGAVVFRFLLLRCTLVASVTAASNDALINSAPATDAESTLASA